MPQTATFRTAILGIGNNTGIAVPPEIVEQLGGGKRAPVTVDLDGYRYASTVAVMRGAFMLPFAKEHREASGFGAGDEVTVTLELVEGPREVAVPAELLTALDAANLRAAFDSLSYSRRKEHARQVADAKTEATRHRRVAKVLEALRT